MGRPPGFCAAARSGGAKCTCYLSNRPMVDLMCSDLGCGSESSGGTGMNAGGWVGVVEARDAGV